MSAESSTSAVVSPAAPAEHWVGKYFRSLGTEIERRAHEVADAGGGFADVATAVLKELAPPRSIGAPAMAEWIASGEPLPAQVNFNTGFGQPPLVVHVGQSFYLEVLFWFPSRTSIHGHGFSGAFRVLDGYSIQTTYTFIETEVLDEGLRVGELRPRHVELLLPGDVCDIRAEEAFVHSVAHMGFPSLTLVARTFSDNDLIQYDYRRCGVAYLHFRRRKEITRQVDVLFALARRDPAGAAEHLKTYLLRQDDHGRFVTALRLFTRGDAMANAVVAWAAGRWSRVIALAKLVAEEDQRMIRIYRNLAQLADTQAQLLGALCELFGTKEGAMQALETFYPDATPEETFANWVRLVPPLPRSLPPVAGGQGT